MKLPRLLHKREPAPYAGPAPEDALTETPTELLPPPVADRPAADWPAAPAGHAPTPRRPISYRPEPARDEERRLSPERPATGGRAPETTPALELEGLARAPSVGRVARAWQRRLATSAWPRPSLAADCGTLGGASFVAASAVGRTHAHREQQRQDAYGFTTASGLLLCAVADGVSSAQLSAPAADVAVSAALSSAVAFAPGRAPAGFAWLEQAVQDAHAAVAALGRQLLPYDAESGRSCASTLVLAAVRTLGRDELEVQIVSVGDSSALELTAAGDFRTILGPSAGAPANELRDYLPRRSSRLLTRERALARGSTLLLATDGLTHDLRESRTVREWVARQLRGATTPIAAAHVLSYTRQRSSDDLTFVAIRPAAHA